MKYIVMECCDAYAVLMDEDSVFVKAANLHYSVGQTVISPIIMEDNEKTDRSRIKMITKIAASAASLILIFGLGYNYYSNNYKAFATIYISADSEYKVVLNKKNEVLSVASNDKNGENILKNYSIKGKDKETVTAELIMLEKQNGLIADGENIAVHVESDDEKFSEKYYADVEKRISELNLNFSVTDNQNNEKVSAPEAPEVPENNAAAPEIADAPKPVPPNEEHTPELPHIPYNPNKETLPIVPDSIVPPPFAEPAEHEKPVPPNDNHKPEMPDIPENHQNNANPELKHDEIDVHGHLIPDAGPETNAADHKPENNGHGNNGNEPLPPPHDDMIPSDESEQRKDKVLSTDSEHKNTPPTNPEKPNEKHDEKDSHDNRDHE